MKESKLKEVFQEFQYKVDMNRINYDKNGVDNYDKILHDSITSLRQLLLDEVLGEPDGKLYSERKKAIEDL